MIKREVESWSIKDLYKLKDQINVPDYQREPKLWRIPSKALLIDSIINKIDIPKLYFNKLEKGEYEVIDGQQRLWAIWEYLDDAYPCNINGKQQKFSQLDKTMRDSILNYQLQITMISNVNDEYLRELFIRLQLGLLLVAGEKLHAATGSIRDFIFKKMVKHKIIQEIAILGRRYAKETLCAQICINSFSIAQNAGFSRTRYEDLEYFFKSYKTLEADKKVFFDTQCESIMKALDTLNKYFSGHTKSLKNRSLLLSIYLYVEKYIKMNPPKEAEKDLPIFVKFIEKLIARLKDEAKKGIDRKNRELYVFDSYLSNAPGEKYQIERRDSKLKEYFEHFIKNKKIIGD